MSRETDIKLLMDDWEEKHKNNGYKRFIRDGIVGSTAHTKSMLFLKGSIHF